MSGPEEAEEKLMEEAVNMGWPNNYVATPMKNPTLHAQLRVITLSPHNPEILLVLLDHYYELRNALANGESFVNHNGYEITLPVNFNWLFYTVRFELFFVSYYLFSFSDVY